MFDLLRKIPVPHVFALILGVIFVCSVLTYVLPSGRYERKQVEIEGSKRTVVVPGTYTSVDKFVSSEGLLLDVSPPEGEAVPTSFHGFLSAVPRGMEKAADIIFFIFVIGGVFGILSRTGVITAAIQAIVDSVGKKPWILIIVVMVLFSFGGSTLGMGEEFIPLVPIFVMVATRLGYDRIFGMAMVILAAQVGFAAATTNPFTVVIAQGIAEVPIYSGMWFRAIFYVVILTITLVYLIYYGEKVRKNPEASHVADVPGKTLESENVEFTSRHLWIIIASSLIFIGVLAGVILKHWWMAEMGGGFMLMGILAAAIAGLKVNEAASAFVKGMEEMVVAALVVGFARGIEVVLSNAMVLDTIVYHSASLLENLPNIVAVQGMLLFQTVLNFLIPSGSGQAAVTMPLMAPLADVLGITRQTAVFAFQCGDGFSNLIIPTSGILMSMLSLASIPYDRWLRFMLPLFGMFLLTSGIFLAIAVVIQL
ncbi:YfcC family protein [Acanthopleuribacter pedis]|uniref:YfcC family protein n=1 Tax=Acanthopleuribacter pedis TaxID=442870 RepID=A0A8J7QDP5_9BACT|nr:AbgT family transporter [Acanthopleuribacter pedis]MBO1322647.1 YfcC family protein [Acanthopleuribacter pedis]